MRRCSLCRPALAACCDSTCPEPLRLALDLLRLLRSIPWPFKTLHSQIGVQTAATIVVAVELRPSTLSSHLRPSSAQIEPR